MDDLLKFAIEAHGGLERWHQFNVVKANASIRGTLWQLKGQPDLLKNVQVVAGPNGAAASSEVRGRLDSKINIKKYSSGKFNSQNAGNCQDSVMSISASTFVFSEIQWGTPLYCLWWRRSGERKGVPHGRDDDMDQAS